MQSFFLEDAVEFTRFVIEEKSSFARPLKQMNAVRQGQSWQMFEEDYNADPAKPPGERVKDENLTVKQLMYRYAGSNCWKEISPTNFEAFKVSLLQ